MKQTAITNRWTSLTACLLAGLGAAACAGPELNNPEAIRQTTPEAVLVTESDYGSEVELLCGQELVITLPSVAGLRDAWEVAIIGETHLFQIGESEFTEPDPDNPEESGLQTFRFGCLTPGISRLELLYPFSDQDDVAGISFWIDVVTK